MRWHVLVVFVLAVLATPAAWAGDRDCDKTPFTNFLFAVGDKLDCYFTIETWQPEEQHPSSFYDARSPDDKISSIDALIAKLKRDLPGVTVTRDPRNGRIIHLIDAGLLNQNRYALDKQASINFSGPLEDLPNELGKNMWYAVQRSEPLGCDFQNDVVTMVKVRFEGKAIRQILTDAVPLKNYGRILWIAQTYAHKSDNQPGSEITYIGPKLISASGESDGANVQISLPVECTYARPMLATVKISNSGEKPFMCMEVAGIPNDKMTMSIENFETGKPVEMNDRGVLFMANIREGGAQGGIGRLRKGESLERTIDPRRFFTLAAGRYRFTAKFSLYREPDYRGIPVTVGPMDLVVAK